MHIKCISRPLIVLSLCQIQCLIQHHATLCSIALMHKQNLVLFHKTCPPLACLPPPDIRSIMRVQIVVVCAVYQMLCSFQYLHIQFSVQLHFSCIVLLTRHSHKATLQKSCRFRALINQPEATMAEIKKILFFQEFT